jgi:outer membrane murein-binding lipoprotein Lpp
MDLRSLMAFTVHDFQDLLSILEQQPEWRAQLRRLVLSDAGIDLPATLQAIAAAQHLTDERLAALVDEVRALTAAQTRTDMRIDALAEQMQTLTARLDSLTVRIDALAEQVQTLAVRIDALADRFDSRLVKIDDDLGKMKGILLEMRYRDRAHNFLRRILRRARPLSPDELFRRVDQAVQAGLISADEAEEIELADLVARGRRTLDDDEVFAVVEVSWGIGPDDVRRAAERAVLLAKTGVKTLAIVAGEWVSPDAIGDANRRQVWCVLDGAAIAPELTARPEPF